jgi:hypothetical protein
MSNLNSNTFRTPKIYVDPIEKSFRIELQRQRALHAIQRRELDLSAHRRRQLEEKAQLNWERRCEIAALKDPSSAELTEKSDLEREAGLHGWIHPNVEKEFLSSYPEDSFDPKSKITLLATPEAYDQREARPAHYHKARVSAMKTLTALQTIQRSILIDEHEKDVRVPEAHAAVALNNMNKGLSSKNKPASQLFKKKQVLTAAAAATTAAESSSSSASASSASSGAVAAADVDSGGAISMSTAASELDLSSAVGAADSIAAESHGHHAPGQLNKKKRPRESASGVGEVDDADQDGADAADLLENNINNNEDNDLEEMNEFGDGANSSGVAKKSTKIISETERLYADMKKAKERALMFAGMRGCDRCGTIIAKSDSVSCGFCKRDFCDRGGKHYEDPSIIPCVDLYRCLCGSKFCYDCVIGSEGRTLGPLIRCAVCPRKSSNWMCRRELRESNASRCPVCNAHACRVCKGAQGAESGVRTAFEIHVDRCIKTQSAEK